MDWSLKSFNLKTKEQWVLIEELVSREDTATALEAETASKQQEKETAENMRKKATETLGETNKRKSESKDGSTGKWGKSGRCAKPLAHFLREKSEADREIRQQELEIRKQEQQRKQQVFQTLLQNQKQMNGMILAVVQKILDNRGNIPNMMQKLQN